MCFLEQRDLAGAKGFQSNCVLTIVFIQDSLLSLYKYSEIWAIIKVQSHVT